MVFLAPRASRGMQPQTLNPPCSALRTQPLVPSKPPRTPRCGIVAQAAPFKDWFDSFIPKPATSNVISGVDGTNGSEVAEGPPQQPAKRDFLEARQVSIYQLVDSDEFRFDVPLYQRPYSWEKKQVYELLQDLLTAYKGGQEYFLGAVVTTRSDETPGTPYQVIDGQQRLTSIFIMLAFFLSWAKDNHNEILQQRVRRMLHIEADPLNSRSTSRFRLNLRVSDHDFFAKNILEEFLPVKCEFSGLMNFSNGAQRRVEEASVSRNGSSSRGSSVLVQDVMQLENESHWRLYESANFMRDHLTELSSNGLLNLQEFMNHCLRSCFLVMMTARDERASFRIFSTLNGRGMDISEVDKLKADMLEVLDPSERELYSSRWSDIENMLGRKNFEKVFTHMKDLASVLEPEVGNLTVLEYFNRSRLKDQTTVTRVMQVAMSYASLMFQLRKGQWSGSMAGLTADTSATLSQSDAAQLPELQLQSSLMNLFTDESYMPSTLEFLMQVHSVPLRLRFLKAAEALQLFLELEGNPSLKVARWRQVSLALFARPLDPERVLEALELSSEDKATFLARLDSRDLFTRAEPRTMAHLLLRAEDQAAMHSMPNAGNSFDTWHRRLLVDRMMPPTAPEGSLWRKTKLAKSAEHAQEGADSSSESEVKYWYDMQRIHWHAKLGNLVLFLSEGSGMSAVETADYDAKAEFLRSCGAQDSFPNFTGSMVTPYGKYSAHKFSFEECRQRHHDLIESLSGVFNLQ